MSLLRNCTRLAHNFRSQTGHYRNLSFSPKTHSTYTVEEVRIPIPSSDGDSFLAGKLWQSVKSSKNQPPSPLKQPPILCMHGLQDNCGSFDTLLPLLLSQGHGQDLTHDLSIFALDLPGHGLSTSTKELYYNLFFEGLLSIHRVLRHFSWEKVTLLGHSLGAIISFIFCASFPEHVHKYIALDNFRPIPRSDDPTKAFQNLVAKSFEVETKLFKTSSKILRPSYTAEELIRRTFESRNETVSLEGCRHLLARGSEKVIVAGEERYRFTHDIKTNIRAGLQLLSNEQTLNLARRIRAPVCVMKGDPGEDYEPRENYLKVVDLVSKSAERLEFHTIPGTHHFHLNSPELVAPIINKFLVS